MYRPEGWENDYHTDRVKSDECLHTEIELHSAYEAGADAMLEGLRKNSPRLFDTTIKEAGIKLERLPEERGTWYFIPEE